MLGLLPAGLWQLRVVVREVEPLGLLVLIAVYQVVREVLLGGVLPHLDPCSSDYSRVAGAGLRLHPEELLDQDPMGLDPQKGFAEMYKDDGVEDTVGVEVEVLEAVVPHEPLEEVARRRDSPRSANRADIGISSGFFSMGYGSPAAALHMPTSFSRRNPLLRRASKSSVFALDFFHSRFGFGRGGDTSGDVPAADPAASSRALFFLPVAFMVFDGDGFILQVHSVFTRIRSGAAVVASYSGAPVSKPYSVATVRTSGDSLLDLLGMATAA
jgi:hypothetical protein